MANNQHDQNRMAYEELESILDVSFDSITIADGNGVFIRASKSCYELLGVDPSELIGKSASEAEMSGIFDNSITKVVLNKKERTTIVQKTGANKIIMVTGIPIFNPEGKIRKIINISRDITETEKLTNELTVLQKELDWYKKELKKRNSLENISIVYKSPAMMKILEQIRHVADMPVTVLLLGETGAGKGYYAKYIHKLSKRKDMPFVIINCGAIPENLLESELFGYEKGAFTGASKEGKKGLFEVAGNGTIFLDEIGEMPLNLQVKLLHVLDDKKARRIGGSVSYDLNARIIAATNRDLKELVEQGEFREDLFYRLNIVPIRIPSLRDRKEDLADLIYMFLENSNVKYKTNKKISDDALERLYDYDFPGNIRELENMIERLVINSFEDTITISNVIDVIGPSVHYRNNKIVPLKTAIEKLERDLLLAAFKKYKTTRKVAEVLDIDQSTVVKKAKKLNVSPGMGGGE